MMNHLIPRFDHRAQYESIRAEVLAAIDGVLRSGTLILGPQVREFEFEASRFLGNGIDAIGVGNGTDALALALRAVGVGPGDEVITVANTSIATASAIRMAGAMPTFCDIDPETLQMSTADARKRISSRTKAIIPVHLFGNAVDMPELRRLADLFGLAVIEDCAQSFGTTIHGRATGTWGDVGCYSFYPTKNLGAYGDGGLCVTNRPELADRLRELRVYGSPHGEPAEREGVNTRLDEIQAAILRIKLAHLPGWLERRRQIAAIYEEHLPPPCRIPRITPGTVHSYHLYVVRVRDRQRLIMRLRDVGIECGIHFQTTLHLMPVFQHLRFTAGSLANTELAATQVVSLPCYPELADEEVKEVCRAVTEAMAD